jgi:hypothetical protein
MNIQGNRFSDDKMPYKLINKVYDILPFAAFITLAIGASHARGFQVQIVKPCVFMSSSSGTVFMSSSSGTVFMSSSSGMGSQTPSNQAVPSGMGSQTPSNQAVPSGMGGETPSNQPEPSGMGGETPSNQPVPSGMGGETPSNQPVPSGMGGQASPESDQDDDQSNQPLFGPPPEPFTDYLLQNCKVCKQPCNQCTTNLVLHNEECTSCTGQCPPRHFFHGPRPNPGRNYNAVGSLTANDRRKIRESGATDYLVEDEWEMAQKPGATDSLVDIFTQHRYSKKKQVLSRAKIRVPRPVGGRTDCYEWKVGHRLWRTSNRLRGDAALAKRPKFQINGQTRNDDEAGPSGVNGQTRNDDEAGPSGVNGQTRNDDEAGSSGVNGQTRNDEAGSFGVNGQTRNDDEAGSSGVNGQTRNDEAVPSGIDGQTPGEMSTSELGNLIEFIVNRKKSSR